MTMTMTDEQDLMLARINDLRAAVHPGSTLEREALARLEQFVERGKVVWCLPFEGQWQIQIDGHTESWTNYLLRIWRAYYQYE